MPTIIVQAHTTQSDPRRVTLTERALPVHLHCDHYLEQLVERLSWALLDAERVEASEGRTPSGESELMAAAAGRQDRRATAGAHAERGTLGRSKSTSRARA
jgi:hypothetical protein